MKRRLLAVLVALALAALGCLAVVAYVRSADQRAIAGREAVWVLVAAKPIPAGTSGAQVRDRGYVRRVTMPAATVPDGAVESVDEQLLRLAITADVQASQLIMRGMFAESSRITGGLAVPEGRLAISMEMTAAARVAGFVRPGSKVAVFHTYTMRAGKGRLPAGDGLTNRHDLNHATRVLLPRVDVIAVGERGTAGVATAVPATGASPAAGTGAAGNAKAGATMLVTVGVTQEEAEKLLHVSLTGTLSLALLDDTATIEPGPGVDNNSLFP